MKGGNVLMKDDYGMEDVLELQKLDVENSDEALVFPTITTTITTITTLWSTISNYRKKF